MMKRKLWRITSCVLTLCLLAASLNFLTNLMERKYSIEKHQPFFEQEADFDVLFLGSSHAVNSFAPMELWNDYGFVSYNLGLDGNRIPLTYWIMENALDYTTPKLIVVDCFFLDADVKTSDTSYSHVHMALDAFPLSVTKIKAILDLLNDPAISEKKENGTLVEAEKRTPIGLMWDFSVYHARWNVLDKNDFHITATSEKGAEPRIGVAVPVDITRVGRYEKTKGDTVGIEYLKKLIESCQEREINVLLTFVPYNVQMISDQKEANRVYDIAAECGVNYINFLEMDIVDYNTDLGDTGHLNPSGARKVSDYLGNYIMENYQIPDQRGNPEYAGWFEDYEEYKAKKGRDLQAQSNWDTYLMLLANKGFDAIIEIRDPELWNDSRFVSLVKNLGIDMSGVPDAANYLIIRKGGLQAEAAALDTNADTQKDTAMGLLRISHDESGEYSVYLDDTACFVPGGENGGNIRVYVRDSETLETVGQAAF